MLQIIKKPYFCPMNFLRRFYIKKISASLLIALIFFIQVVKTFHTHPVYLQQADFHSKTTPVVHQNYTCPICDFQIAKDSDTEVASIEISCPVHFIATTYYYALPILQSVSASFIARGPPSFS
ncbi:MAG: hypothetical protein WAU24_03200 [Chitinophagaceae bacterium]